MTTGSQGFKADRVMGTMLMILAALVLLASLYFLIDAYNNYKQCNLVMGDGVVMEMEIEYPLAAFCIAGIVGGLGIRKSRAAGFVLVLVVGGIGAGLLCAITKLDSVVAVTFFIPALIFPVYAFARLFRIYGPRPTQG